MFLLSVCKHVPKYFWTILEMFGFAFEKEIEF